MEDELSGGRDPTVQRGTVGTVGLCYLPWRQEIFVAAGRLADAVATLAAYHKMWALTVRRCVALAEGNPARRDANEALSIGARTAAALARS